MNQFAKKLSFLCFLSIFCISQPGTASSLKNQPWSVRKIIREERHVSKTRDLLSIVNSIDQTYTSLPERMLKGEKLIIFFDPAHGKLSDGRWQGGAATRRLSCTGKPEEFYSIQISRRLYSTLRKNPHIDVYSTDDYMKVLKGTSDTYKNIPFRVTVKLARKHNAFIIISEHLNNVSQIHKASGKVNLPGIHITRDRYGRRVLKHVKGLYRGFLTLYNELDSSGFSRQYAVTLKKYHTKAGMKANSWEFGAVGDDRFSYFIDFPISVIYESGFISNPDEEKKLVDEEYQQTLVENQYKTLLETLRTKFGIDITGEKIKIVSPAAKKSSELLKLSRIAVYYIKKSSSKNALKTIRILRSRFRGKKYHKDIAYFKKAAKKISTAERYYRLSKKYRKKRHYRRSRRYMRKARRTIGSKPLFYSYKKKYSRYTRKKKYRKKTRTRYAKQRKNTKKYITVSPSPRWRNIILPIEKGQSLKEAIDLALAADNKTAKKLYRKFNKARIKKYRRIRYYSRKRKRYVRYWKKYYKRIRFTPGIYIVRLDKKLNVVKVKRVTRVLLSSRKFQNQQYLKNSHFATFKRHRSL